MNKLLLLLSATVLIGCGDASPPADAQRNVEAEVQAEAPEDDGLPDRIIYIQWSGSSPGAGFTWTNATVCEVDVKNRRHRSISKTASAPQPMIGHTEEALLALLKPVTWSSTTPDEHSRLRKLLAAWMKTGSPKIYVVEKMLGREDGYLEELIVVTRNVRRVTSINTRRMDDSPSPPDEWKALLSGIGKLAMLWGPGNFRMLQNPIQGLEIETRNGKAFVVSLPGVDLKKVSIPTIEDHKYAKGVTTEIQKLGADYLKRTGVYYPTGPIVLQAARPVGDIILLDYLPGSVRDGNAFLVYSIKDKKILGSFIWYMQG